MSAEFDAIMYDTAIKNGYNKEAAKLIAAQARLESADYSSAVFRNNNNTSGMKFAGQPLAVRGTLAPYKERSDSCKAVTAGQVGGYGPAGCSNRDHYAKFPDVLTSAKDKIERNFEITMGGVTPQMLKAVKTPEEFADLLKRRKYYGASEYGTPGGTRERDNYAAGLRAKLLRVQLAEYLNKNKKNIIILIAGAAVLGAAYYLYKKA